MKNRIGIVGGGQLGKMMTLEAKKMGFFVIYEIYPGKSITPINIVSLINGFV